MPTKTEPRDFKFPQRTTPGRARIVAGVLWTIRLDGPFEEKSGLATSKLHQALKDRDMVLGTATLNGILNGLGPGGEYGYLVDRRMRGKRCYLITLHVDPESKPFPPNPFPANKSASFRSLNAPRPARAEGIDDLEETFARQAMAAPPIFEDPIERLKAVSREEAEPEPEPEPETDAETVTEPEAEPDQAVVAELPDTTPPDEPAELLPEIAGTTDLYASLTTAPFIPAEDTGPRRSVGSSTSLLTGAIDLIVQAMAHKVEEDAARQEASLGDVDARIDQRMGSYVALLERTARLEGQLRASQQRERELIAVIRTQEARAARNGTPPR